MALILPRSFRSIIEERIARADARLCTAPGSVTFVRKALVLRGRGETTSLPV